MKTIQWTVTSVLASILVATAGLAMAMDSGHYLGGLGLHEETGRTIYLGALHLPKDTAKPAALDSLEGPRIMEYRVVARRTSIRSLLGGMLLQSEVATGRAPSDATTEFADLMLSNIRSSLYAGDSLAIHTDDKSYTAAALNGVDIARVADPEVGDYLLMGWVGESGPTTVFREGLAAAVAPDLRNIYEANVYTAERGREVAGWVAPAPEPAEAPEEPAGEDLVADTDVDAAPPEPDAVAPAAPVAASPTENAANIDATATDNAAVVATVLNDTGLADPAANEEDAAAAPGAQATGEEDAAVGEAVSELVADVTQTAALLAPGATQTAPLEETTDVMSMDVQEYSRRLAEFHGGMVAMVYKQITYPKRAVRRNLQGRLEIDLLLTRDGRFISANLSQSSGHKLLDSAALEAAEVAFADGVSQVDPVAIAEFSQDAESIMIPIPVSFKLAQ